MCRWSREGLVLGGSCPSGADEGNPSVSCRRPAGSSPLLALILCRAMSLAPGVKMSTEWTKRGVYFPGALV